MNTLETPEDIITRINRCKRLIRNWEVLDGIDLDFTDVRIDGLLVDRQPDDDGEKWEISLLTTVNTRTGKDGRDVYRVRWGFKDLWGNLAFFSLQGHILTGSLSLTYIDYDDFAIVGFSIVRTDGTPVFRFNEPDEISVVSARKVSHQTPRDIYPEDYE